ncbi:MAG: Ni/Fe-hydrogenase cytochrome b subunit [Candidatus Marinimicrobia bacterium]|nr:Ni/Fe-hydrogenase cytochrome b subunit [Candidatus Neomarinimicrobiota bacterium]MBL6985285.1 Ni/Fe-hydrogenase cytochrome b subunit [Candidatus Thioglobus sp.]
MSEHRPIGGKILTKPFLVLALIAFIAFILVVKRFLLGIGSVTNLNDGYPWGLWIVYDVLVGTAFGCGGYAMALLVYIFNKGKYHPLIRPAIMTSVFGYTLAGASIILDVGRYWNLYNMFWPKYANINSVMVEVAICVASYVMILWIEFSPSFFENWRKGGTPKYINKFMFVFIAIGVLLPTLHQSSLGTLMIIAGNRLFPLWQTNWLPLLFLISALTMGFGMIIFESLFSSVILNRPLEMSMLKKLSAIVSKLLLIFLIFRFGDLIWRNEISTIFNPGFKQFMFFLENALIILPMIVLFIRKQSENPRSLFLTAASILIAGTLYRFNTYLVGFDPGYGWQYFPSIPEIVVTLGIISVELMAYLVFVKKLPVLPTVRQIENN